MCGEERLRHLECDLEPLPGLHRTVFEDCLSVSFGIHPFQVSPSHWKNDTGQMGTEQRVSFKI